MMEKGKDGKMAQGNLRERGERGSASREGRINRMGRIDDVSGRCVGLLNHRRDHSRGECNMSFSFVKKKAYLLFLILAIATFVTNRLS
jgi:hypothetical protein